VLTGVASGGKPPTAVAPLGAGERVDVDRASASALMRVPGIGPGLARRIVSARAEGGPFGGPACLAERVRGVGAGTLKRLGPHLAYSAGGCAAGAGVGGCPEVVDINTATVAEWDCLPGIGPVRAESLVAWRGRRGPLGSVDDLREAPGLPARLLERLRPRLTVGGVP
jgi:competence protein ComEA